MMWPSRAEFPFPSAHITKLIVDGFSYMDADYPQGRCGFGSWAEFNDRKTAEAFRAALYEFVRTWKPGSGSPDE